MKKELFDFNDILLKPSKVSRIYSRTQINPSHDGFLPIFTAPMDTVVSSDNYQQFLDAWINVCLPRGEAGDGNHCFISYSLKGIKEEIQFLNPRGRYLIDVANGHMEELVTVIKDIKFLYPNITLMVGNIANPKTFKVLSKAGADYIRVGIGNGNGCLTTQQVAIGYPMGSLISDCRKVVAKLNNPAKIVADGGMKSYSDIIKALALGADYVMVGSLLNKTIESSGDNYIFKRLKVSGGIAKWLFEHNFPVYKKFRGMSTKEVQKKWGRETLKTSEGVVRVRKVEFSLNTWVENLEDYLKSAMSYSDAMDLGEFIGKAKYNLITMNAYLRFKK